MENKEINMDAYGNRLADFELVNNKLESVGAELCLTGQVTDANFENAINLWFWNVFEKGVIVCGYEDGGVGMYQFVGEDYAPVTSDLAFIDRLVAQQIKEVE